MLRFYKLLFPVAWIAFLVYWQMWARISHTNATQLLEPLSSRILRILIVSIAIVHLATNQIPLPWLYHPLWLSGPWFFWTGAVVLVTGLFFAI